MDCDALTDRDLVARAQRGDAAAAEVLVRRYEDDVRKYCFTALADPEDAKDAVQTTFEMVLRRLPTFEGGEKVGRYIMATARGRCLTALRRARRAGTPAELRDHHAIDDAPHAHVDDVLNLNAILAELSAREQDLLIERHLQEQPLAAMAAQRDTSSGSVAVMVHRAVKSARLIATNRDMWATIPAAVVARLLAWATPRDHTTTAALAAPATVAAVAAGVLMLAPTTPAPAPLATPTAPIDVAAARGSLNETVDLDDVGNETDTSQQTPRSAPGESRGADGQGHDQDQVETLAPIPRTSVPGTDRTITQDFPDEADYRYSISAAETEIVALDSTDEDQQRAVHDQTCPPLGGTPVLNCTTHD